MKIPKKTKMKLLKNCLINQLDKLTKDIELNGYGKMKFPICLLIMVLLINVWNLC
ncbi:unnamed protein product [Meloidogyne enterolobii]|uniref:Uncharacterized protein n=1 Tax=Meloidogyne enterolobii TaxID=390850 RepID=A0ACB0YYU2_MELEN